MRAASEKARQRDAKTIKTNESGVQVVYVADRKSLAVVVRDDQEFPWVELALDLAGGLADGAGSWVAGKVLDMIFPPKVNDDWKAAIAQLPGINQHHR
jgi:hypothetical protein